jgi:hypothetical protein
MKCEINFDNMFPIIGIFQIIEANFLMQKPIPDNSRFSLLNNLILSKERLLVVPIYLFR